MAFGTWFKNLITKGKAFIKKAAPYIRKGIDVAKKIAPVFGGTIGNIVNGVANGLDNVLNKIAPIELSPRSDESQSGPPQSLERGVHQNKIEMIDRPMINSMLGGNKGKLIPILK